MSFRFYTGVCVLFSILIVRHDPLKVIVSAKLHSLLSSLRSPIGDCRVAHTAGSAIEAPAAGKPDVLLP